MVVAEEETERDQWFFFETAAEFGPAALFEEVTVESSEQRAGQRAKGWTNWLPSNEEGRGRDIGAVGVCWEEEGEEVQMSRGRSGGGAVIMASYMEWRRQRYCRERCCLF